MSALLVGRDPFDLQALDVDANARPDATAAELAIVAAAGTAMADICGKQLGVPVHQLMGGRVRDRVRACAIDWADHGLDVGGLVAEARRIVALGFTCLRVEPFAVGITVPPVHVGDAVKLVRTLRGALPDAIDLVVATGGALAIDDLHALAALLGPLEPLWMEQPFRGPPSESIEQATKRLAVPLTAGSGTGPATMKQLVMGGLVDHVVLDVGLVGGLLEARRIAALAEIDHIGVIPTGTAPVSLATALHLAASIPNLTMVEMRPGLAAVEDGTVAIDLSPGLGIDEGRAMAMEVA